MAMDSTFKATIAIDVDEVVANLVPVWIGELLKRNPECPNPITEEWTTWDIHDCIHPKFHEELYAILEEPTTYDNVSAITGAFSGVEILRAMDFRIVFVTSATGGNAGVKRRWLVRNGFLADLRYTPDYVEAADKTLIRADLILDDRPKTCLRYWETYGPYRSLLFMPRFIHERYRPNLPFVTNWQDVPGRIERLLVEQNRYPTGL